MKIRVLHIDDEEMFTTAVKSNLEATGDFEVFSVNDSTLAVDMIRKVKPNIILLDIIMPNVEGVDVLECMESDPDIKDIPVLIVTAMIGHGDTSDDGVVRFGKHVLLAKPIEVSTMIRSINDKLAGRM